MKNRKNSNTLSTVRQKTHDGVDRIINRAEDFEEDSKESLINLKENATKVRENINSYIEDNPEKSILIATGVGAVIGAMLTSYMMRR
jgi:ElaB/YqjD/DUF883 family membrane-anchored ribosome-binding protein